MRRRREGANCLAETRGITALVPLSSLRESPKWYAANEREKIKIECDDTHATTTMFSSCGRSASSSNSINASLSSHKRRKPMLYYLIINRQWEEVEAQCRVILSEQQESASSTSRCNEASQEITFYIYHIGKCRALPIHLACAYHAPVSTIQCLLKAHPASVFVPESTLHFLPLHFACMKATKITASTGCIQTQLAVIQILHQAYPNAVQEQESFAGYLPLHLYCHNFKYHFSNHCNGNIASSQDKGNFCNILQYLIQQYPHSIDVQDIFGDTPLDILKKQMSAMGMSSCDSNGKHDVFRSCCMASTGNVMQEQLVQWFQAFLNSQKDCQTKAGTNISSESIQNNERHTTRAGNYQQPLQIVCTLNPSSSLLNSRKRKFNSRFKAIHKKHAQQSMDNESKRNSMNPFYEISVATSDKPGSRSSARSTDEHVDYSCDTHKEQTWYVFGVMLYEVLLKLRTLLLVTHDELGVR